MELLGGVADSVVSFVVFLQDYAIPFLIAITVLVFVHEMGHYLVARWCGVRVEVFSVGFGREIWGRTDSRGTRWKLGWIPIGGYVKMFGEMFPPAGDRSAEPGPSAADERVSFHTKPLWRRAAIVFAGPFANFLFAAALMAGIFATIGELSTPSNITAVVEGSAAERAGLKPGDVIRRIDGTEIDRFEQVARIVRMSAGIRLEIEVERDGRLVALVAVPDEVRQEGAAGSQKIGRLGVSRSGGGVTVVRHDPGEAALRGIAETFRIVGEIFRAIGQMLSGARDASDLGGPLRIAQISGDVWQAGLLSMVAFVATLSINLGLINLFPIPLLDGGHLMFYAVEAVTGRPPGERVREYGYRMGIAMLLGLMVFVTWNDLLELRVVDFFVGLVT
ncbi:MAG: RIP metalloprotease RseP [Defluviicoccus sp.]|nr:RIP metalloprotease RseP [Defluviicoccus sp.]MDE0386959.1 RIP metalloprotease RseP [Defluviicoccus sp.]